VRDHVRTPGHREVVAQVVDGAAPVEAEGAQQVARVAVATGRGAQFVAHALAQLPVVTEDEAAEGQVQLHLVGGLGDFRAADAVVRRHERQAIAGAEVRQEEAVVGVGLPVQARQRVGVEGRHGQPHVVVVLQGGLGYLADEAAPRGQGEAEAAAQRPFRMKAGVEQAGLDRRVPAVVPGNAALQLDQAADAAAVARPEAAGIQVHRAQAERVVRRLHAPEVEQQGDVDAVEQEPRIEVAAAAHDDGARVGHRRARHAGQRLHAADHVAAGAGKPLHLVPGERLPRRLQFGPAAVDHDFLRIVLPPAQADRELHELVGPDRLGRLERGIARVRERDGHLPGRQGAEAEGPGRVGVGDQALFIGVLALEPAELADVGGPGHRQRSGVGSDEGQLDHGAADRRLGAPFQHLAGQVHALVGQGRGLRPGSGAHRQRAGQCQQAGQRQQGWEARTHSCHLAINSPERPRQR
jgi:hypothetical protein